jgi:hypothetical protein
MCKKKRSTPALVALVYQSKCTHLSATALETLNQSDDILFYFFYSVFNVVIGN